MRYALFGFMILIVSSEVNAFCKNNSDTIEFVARVMATDSAPLNRIDAYDIETKFLILVEIKEGSKQIGQDRIVLRQYSFPSSFNIKENTFYRFKVTVEKNEPVKEYKNKIKEFILREDSELIYSIIYFDEI